MGILQVDNIIAQSSANVLTLGVSGNTVTVPANVTFNALGANVYIPSAIAKLDAITPSNTSTYNLTYGGSPYSPASATACLVSLNGIIQAPTTAFTISANTISFSTALTSTDVIDFITVLAAPYTLNVPGSATVGIAQLSATGTPSSSTYLRGDNTWAAVASPIVWNQTVQSTNFTASVNVGYMVNTSTAAVTVTLPASPSIGDQIQFVDYNETAAINNIILNPNGLKIDGTTDSTRILNSGEGVTILYTGTTRGWIPVSAANEGTTALASPFSVDFLVVGGGASGGGDGGAGGGAGGFRTSTQTVSPGTVITVTVGDGGAAQTASDAGNNGSSSSISGSGLTTITSAGGGGGGYGATSGKNGGSGGGGSPTNQGGTFGSGNTPSTSPSQGNNGGLGYDGTIACTYCGGGGGAGAVGSNSAQSCGTNNAGGIGGNGTASSITGSSVTYAGGGAGAANTGGGGNGGGSSGGSGGGGASGAYNSSNGTAGTANLGAGGGAGGYNYDSGAGGKGVVIISLATIHYSGTSSGSPTVTTSGSNTILTFTGSGTYTA